MSEKMNNQTLRESVQELNTATGKEFIVNSFDMGDNDKTQYGLVKRNKDGTMDQTLEAKYNKREIYYHIQGYLTLSQMTTDTLIVEKSKPKPPEKPSKTPSKKNKNKKGESEE